MAKEIDRVCQKYEEKLLTGRSSHRFDQDHQRQVDNFREVQSRSEAVRSAVAAALTLTRGTGPGLQTYWTGYWTASGG
jgi:hypothetical protein